MIDEKKWRCKTVFFVSFFFLSLFSAEKTEREREGEGGRTDNGASFFYTLRDLPIVRIRWVDDFVIKLSPLEIK